MSKIHTNSKNEIEELLSFDYQQIIEYLLNKYDVIEENYMTKSWTPRIKLIKKGLILHHIDSNKIANLSNGNIAKTLPLDYQRPSRLVYCDIIEHLILHIKIAESNDWDGNCGIEDIYTEMIPKLNDICSGCWGLNNYKKNMDIEQLTNQYLKIIEYIKQFSWSKEIPILTSYNAKYEWDENNNINIYNKIKKIGFKSLDLNIKFNNSKLSLEQQKKILKLIKNFEKWNIQKRNRLIRKEIAFKNNLIKLKEKKEKNILKQKAKKLAETYFEQWNINNNNFKNCTAHINLKLKNNLSVNQYLIFIEKLLNDQFSFFIYKNDEFEYYGFNKNDYDKYLQQYSSCKKNNELYEIKEC